MLGSSLSVESAATEEQPVCGDHRERGQPWVPSEGQCRPESITLPWYNPQHFPSTKHIQEGVSRKEFKEK